MPKQRGPILILAHEEGFKVCSEEDGQQDKGQMGVSIKEDIPFVAGFIIRGQYDKDP